MKILFVEDELSSNIDRIVELFENYLEHSIIKQLKELKDDPTGFGASNQDIKEVFENSGLIDIEFKFSAALYKVINDYQNYSLFIIDRNLASEDYNTEMIHEIDQNFDEKLHNKYHEREGDYLLQKLVYQGADVLSQFYFLTAYSASELPNADEIKNHIDLKKFKEKNLIEKGNSESKNYLMNRINNLEILKLHWENKVFIDILRKKVGKNLPYKFIELLKNKDSSDSVRTEMSFDLIRNLLENILTELAKKQNAPKICFNKKSEKQIITRNVIKWINDFNKEKEEPIYRFNSNSIIKNFLYDIQGICSDFGAHKKSEMTGFQPTSNTVNALIFELKDIILWFNDLE